MKKPVTITITGAAGNIGYALAFRVASGQMLGPDQPINLNLLEIPAASAAVNGVVMELNDCAFATLNKVTATSDANVGFKDCNFAMLVGARPRGPGMERKDLLLENAKIFSAQGKALDAVAGRDVRVLVVGNPANTNSLIAQRNAPSLPRNHFTAMTRLDHNRGLSQLTEKTGAPLSTKRSLRSMPGPRGLAPTSIAKLQSLKPTAASDVAVTLFSVANAQSFNSITTPLTAALAAGISSRFKLIG